MDKAQQTYSTGLVGQRSHDDERTYWLHRSRVSSAMARRASDARAKLVHYELSGRYALAALAALASGERG